MGRRRKRKRREGEIQIAKNFIYIPTPLDPPVDPDFPFELRGNQDTY
jgi:hypothetical protein